MNPGVQQHCHDILRLLSGICSWQATVQIWFRTLPSSVLQVTCYLCSRHCPPQAMVIQAACVQACTLNDDTFRGTLESWAIMGCSSIISYCNRGKMFCMVPSVQQDCGGTPPGLSKILLLTNRRPKFSLGHLAAADYRYSCHHLFSLWICGTSLARYS